MVDSDKSSFSSTEMAPENDGPTKANLRAGENAEETIKRLLSTYDIGSKLRQLRLRKKIALIDLGRHTGLSASMLSQLENGKLIPTLPTLTRIAMVFDVGLEFFFGEKRQKRVFSIVRAQERMVFPEQPESAFPGYYFEVLNYGAVDKGLNAYLADFPKHENHHSKEHSHEGSEFIHILSGDLSIFYQNEEHVLHAGDSVYFEASEPHAYQGHSETPTKAIVITTPPRL
ncbi:MAG TPA: XRE family transcriptional regulator [Bryobacteraceae bacterium]|jgi:transcriptional regulator with XRE-family HTH domain|nr:XRE family transcriptional regulator [Bryobacteraceae bacterium]